MKMDSHNSGFFPSAVIFYTLFTLATTTLAGTYSGGSGTAQDPYKISSVADWQELIGTSADYGKNFILLNDIDFEGINLTPVAPDTVAVNYTFDGTPFTGVFDGNGYVLSNAVIDLPSIDYVGLFGYLDSASQVRNLSVEHISVTGRNSVAGLAGCNVGTLTSCSSTGSVISKGAGVGGLIGANLQGTITSCYAFGDVNGSESKIGGLVGINFQGMITACCSSGKVSGFYIIGGLVGHNYQGTFNACYSTSNVSDSSEYSTVGGLAGKNEGGTIMNCYASGIVKGSIHNRGGGLIGYNYQGTITNCYATGTVLGAGDFVGGLVGWAYDSVITSCFWDIQTTNQAGSSGGKGLSTDQMKTLSIFQNAGWADRGWTMQDGLDCPRLSWEHAEGTLIPPVVIPFAGSGTAEDPYVISTTEEFAALSWYSDILDKNIILNEDLNLSGVVLYPIGDLGHFTGMFKGQGHTLRDVIIQHPGSDSVGLFAIIGSGGHIQNLNMEKMSIEGRYYVGGLVGYNFGEISSCNVGGSVKGNNDYVGGLMGLNRFGILANCYASGSVSGTAYIGGLVGSDEGGSLTDCNTTNSVSGSQKIGGLVGYNSGKITACYATGTISSSADYSEVGGLVGENFYGTLLVCYAMGRVSGYEYVGGLVGRHYNDTITACYATGAVNGNFDVGGLVGYNEYGAITDCYASGFVRGSGDTAGGLVGRNNYDGTVESCFWDKQTTGQPDGYPGTALTTAEMKTISTFTGAGWDFVGESANGTADVWRICVDGVDYPRLSWEFSQDGDLNCPDGVGLEDLVYLAGRWMKGTAATSGAADSDGDGKVDLADFGIVASNWMRE